ncbi:MAG: sigma 54-interacting transcriptional regulator [Candidatus Latescibacterota bacterium]
MNPTPFVGRAADLSLLRHQLDLGHQQGPRLLLLSGPGGSGKTALMGRFTESLVGESRAAAGRAWDNRAAASYHALREVMVQLLEGRRTGSALVQTFLQGRSGGRAQPLAPGPLFQAIDRVVGAEARRVPLCLFLDDLQWADEGTCEWLDYTMTHAQAAPALWVGAYRSEEAPSLGPLLRRVPSWCSTGRFAEHSVPPLSRDEVTALVRGMVGSDAALDWLPERVWQRSEGNALLAVEEVRAAVDGDQAPRTGEQLITARIRRLTADDRELLSVAAVAGARFSADAVADVLASDPLAVARRLERLRLDHCLVEQEGDGYRFTHCRFREVFLAQLNEALRRGYHDRLSRVDATGSSERAYHVVRGSDVEAGVDALVAEGDEAQHWRDAIRYYTEALVLAQQPGDPRPRLQRVGYERIGDLYLNLGKHILARPYYAAAVSWARSADERASLLYRLGRTYRGDSPERRRLEEEAAGLAAEITDPVLADWVRFPSGGTSEASQDPAWALRTYALGQHLKRHPMVPERIVAEAMGAFALAALEVGQPEALSRVAERLGPFPPNSYLAARLHDVRAVLRLAQGDVAGGTRHLRVARRIYQAIGNDVEVYYNCDRELDSTVTERGDYEQARRRVGQLVSSRSTAMLYRHCCKTWIVDRPASGLVWAQRYVDGVEAFYTEYATDGGHLRGLLADLGAVERILRALGGPREFEQRISRLQASLRAAGYRTDVAWHLGESADLPACTAAPPTSHWVWSPGGQGRADWGTDAETIVVRVPNSRGADPMDLPRLAWKVRGSFALEATLHPGSEVTQTLRQCFGRPAGLLPLPAGAGAGGLFVRGGSPWQYACLSVHREGPGEVHLLARRDGPSEHLGRGLLHDGAARLRLERRGATLSAYAADPRGKWRSCGRLDIGAWDEVEVGLWAVEPSLLGKGLLTEAVVRFGDVRWEGSAVPARGPEVAPRRCTLPAPAVAPDVPGIVAASAAMQDLLKKVRLASTASLPVLIAGETGVGKELIARALHQLGERRHGPFIPLNCAALPADLVERELFGHIRGAYTGAYETRSGLFEAAHLGVLFLDEIDHATPQFQAALLRVVEEQAVRRLGEHALRPIDVRLVAAANRDLVRAAEQGTFRLDLYYRLCGMELRVMPLRERPEDIPHLMSLALTRWADRRRRPAPAITDQAVAAALSYPWPGNVRELLFAVERAAETAEEGLITPSQLGLRNPQSAGAGVDEHPQVLHALRDAGGNVSAAARRLGISRNTLYRKLRRYGAMPAREG